MASLTQASHFYDLLPSKSEEAFKRIAALVEEVAPEREAEWLDYKNGKDIPLDSEAGKQKIRELWGKALSGFANSGGGVVIWGIQTKTVDNHDVPTNLALVSEPERLEGLLKNYLGTEVDPPVLGVRLRSILSEQGEGFVVAEIPPSQLKPHRSKSQGQYYIRASHQHVEAGPSLLRILFHPASKPVLQLVCESYGGSPAHGFQVRFRILNKGFATAHDLLVFIKDIKEFAFDPFEKQFIKDGSTHNLHRIRAKHPLHPSLGVHMGIGCLNVSNSCTVLIYGKDFEPSQWSVRVGYSIGQIEVQGPFSVNLPVFAPVASVADPITTENKNGEAQL